MNLAHLHLLLNHFPIIGTMIATGLLIASLLGQNEDLRRSSLIIFTAMAVLAIPTFVSGVGAQMVLREQSGIPQPLIRRHEGSAMISFAAMELTGAVALIGLWQRLRSSHPAKRTTLAIVFLSLVTVGLMARTGNTGGEIRHSEIGSVPDATQRKVGTLAHALEPDPARFADALLANKWWWALLMDLHFVGLALIVGTVGVLNLRILGLLKQLPMASLHGAVPWALAGLGINIVTGMMAFVAQSGSYILNAAFWLKILVLMLLGLNLAIFYLTGIFERLQDVKAGDNAPVSAKFVAATSLLLWFLVIALGRYIHLYVDTLPPN